MPLKQKTLTGRERPLHFSMLSRFHLGRQASRGGYGLEMHIVGIVGNGTDARGEMTFEWEISDFFSLSDRMDDCYHSPRFNFGDSRWYLRLYPNGETKYSSAGWADLFVMREDSGAPKSVYYTFGIKGSVGVVEEKGPVVHEFPNEKLMMGSGLPKCWSRSELRCRKSTLMPNDVLTITCSMRSEDPIAIKDYSDSTTQTDSNSLEVEVLPESKQSTEKQGAEEMKESLMRLLTGEEDSDCLIRVRGKEFPAHRALLRARSPVFRAMFAHDTLERQSGVVTMEDCDPETFPGFLEHVYTGSVEVISAENVFGLYEASEKYDLPALKKACARFAKQNLTVASFCEAITLAVQFNDRELVEAATEFYCDHTLDIVKTAEWQVFLAENPTVVNELFIKKLTR